MKKAIIVCDLGYGDSGKGRSIDYFSRKFNDVSFVVRFNGGAQAGHNVITPEGVHHEFSQWGSGTFVPGVNTYLSRYMLVNPLNAYREAEHLEAVGVVNPFSRLFVDKDAPIITPFQIQANRIRELMRGNNPHGSCGAGIGETMDDMLHHNIVVRAGNLQSKGQLRSLLEKIRSFKYYQMSQVYKNYGLNDERISEEVEAIASLSLDTLIDQYKDFSQKVSITDELFFKKRLLSKPGTLLFEGAQGVLLDEWYGFHPYTTWSTTTFENAMTLLEDYDAPIVKFGVIRSYMTRHGAGPFVTEDATLLPALPEPHNVTGKWQGGFRVGEFDAVAISYAVDVCGGVDGLILTHVDRLPIHEMKICDYYKDTKNLWEYRITARKYDGNENAQLTYQQSITDRLFNSEPVYRVLEQPEDDVSLRTDACVGEIEDEVGAPIVFTCFGPSTYDTYERKQLHYD